MADCAPPVPDGGGLAIVGVRDANPVRSARVCEVIRGIGASGLEMADAAPSVCPRVPLVVVGADDASPATLPSLVRSHHERGSRIVAVAANPDAWPLGLRCSTLLAGATAVLDSRSPSFEDILSRVLREAIRDESARHAEGEHLRNAMRQCGVIGRGEAITAVFRLVMRASRVSDLPVLLTGETGTGKELLARSLHRLDARRRDAPFVAFNCAALSPTLAEAELFGHRKGAFTGADRDRAGLFRAADGGVLFLDEIGELDLALQVKLLRALQEGRVLAVGADRETAVDLRIVAATNRDLEEMVAQKRFRADLYHRLNVISIRVPPLRERREDIAPLVEHFLKKHAASCAAGCGGADSGFVEALSQLPLDGNARELENIVRSAMASHDSSMPLGLQDCPVEVLRRFSSPARGIPRKEPGSAPGPLDVLDAHHWNLSGALEFYERLLLEAALASTGGNHTAAGRLLGVTPRTIYNKIRKLGLST